MKKGYSRIAVISDMHLPYHHPDTVSFLAEIKKKYRPDKWVSIGDEADKHSMSFHESDPDLPSAGDELKLTIKKFQPIYKLIPNLDLVDSNHGSMAFRKALANGIPKAYIKSYREVLKAPKGWSWHSDLTLKMSNGEKVYFHHGKCADVLKASQTMAMSMVQGHYHERFKIEYWGNPNGLFWGLQIGCLINDKSLAFAYNKNNTKRPIVGMGIILNGLPKLLPMVLNKKGRWIGELP